jgi:hypothetical protein
MNKQRLRSLYEKHTWGVFLNPSPGNKILHAQAMAAEIFTDRTPEIYDDLQADWRLEVSEGNTVLGLLDWMAGYLEMTQDDWDDDDDSLEGSEDIKEKQQDGNV